MTRARSSWRKARSACGSSPTTTAQRKPPCSRPLSDGGTGAADPLAIGFEKHRRQIVDFIQALQSGRGPAIEGAEARRSVEIIRAIYRSAQTGRPVDLPFADAD